MSVKYMDERFYAEYGDNWDDDRFRETILENLNAESRVLDLGAGAGIVEQMNFKGSAREVCGIDLDDRVLTNPYLDDGRVGSGEQIPYDDNSFDMVFSDNVLEHLEKPGAVFKEVARVLKPNGIFLVKTPNRFHYVALLARLTPHRFHQFITGLRGRTEADTFPTLYRANSRRDLCRLAEDSDLTLTNLQLIEGRPEYLRMTSITYLIGLAYERTVNRFDFLSRFRVLLIGEFLKLRN